MDKKVLRAQLMRQREAVPAGEREKWDGLILGGQLQKWEPYLTSRRVFVYLSVGWEVNTWPVVDDLISRGPPRLCAGGTKKPPPSSAAKAVYLPLQFDPGRFWNFRTARGCSRFGSAAAGSGHCPRVGFLAFRLSNRLRRRILRPLPGGFSGANGWFMLQQFLTHCAC